MLLISILGQACAGHVQLTAPPANAPGPQRVEAYDDLRPIDYQITHTTSRNGGGYSDVEFLQLNNGTKVRLPEDLRPLVPVDSPAAASIRDAYRERKANHWLAFSTFAGMLGGLIVTGLGVGYNVNALKYGGAGMIIGGVVCYPLTNYYANKSNESTARAYDQYDDALRRRLDVCKDGERIVPCP